MSAPKYIYFIKPVGMDGPIKIGCSAKPQSRLITLSAWSPFPLEIVGTAAGDFTDECRLHRRFSDLHTRKEWFMSSPLLRETIERILAGTSIEDACRKIKPKQPIRNQKRPPLTPDRYLFLSYGRKIKSACSLVWRSGEHDRNHSPPDIKLIMHRWRTDRMNNHLPIIPTKEEFSRLDEFIADPGRFCVNYSEAYPYLAKRNMRTEAAHGVAA